MNSDTQIIIYQGEDGGTHIEVRFTGEAVWLSQKQMAELYQTTRPNIVQHIRNIYADGELDESATCKKNFFTGSSGKQSTSVARDSVLQSRHDYFVGI